MPDAARLLAAIADALNAAERAGITVEHPSIALMTSHGDVLPIGDDRLGARWTARPKKGRLWCRHTVPGDIPLCPDRPGRAGITPTPWLAAT